MIIPHKHLAYSPKLELLPQCDVVACQIHQFRQLLLMAQGYKNRQPIMSTLELSIPTSGSEVVDVVLMKVE
jgi:hypothetical protein